MNSLVCGLEETEGNKTKNQTKAIFDKFLTKALGLAPDDIDVVDLHRLPQHPIRREGRKMNRLIIFKVLTTFDKEFIYQNIAKLKEFNEDGDSTVFVTDHLPKFFYNQKKVLLPELHAAKRDKKNRFVGALLRVNTVCTSTINAFVLPIPKD